MRFIAFHNASIRLGLNPIGLSWCSVNGIPARCTAPIGSSQSILLLRLQPGEEAVAQRIQAGSGKTDPHPHPAARAMWLCRRMRATTSRKRLAAYTPTPGAAS